MPTWLIVAGSEYGVFFATFPRYFPPIGFSDRATNEWLTQIMARDSYTLANLYVRVTVNVNSDPTTVRSRKNTANGNMSVSIPATATGVFRDIVNSDALASGDVFNTIADPGAGGNITITVFAYTLSTVANNTPILCASNPTEPAVPNSLTRYGNIGGALSFSIDESTMQYIFRVAATLSNFRVCVSEACPDGNHLVRTRINGANGNQSISFVGGGTGTYEDVVNNDVVAVGNSVNYQAVIGGTSGAAGFTFIQVKSSSLGRQTMASIYTNSLWSNRTRNTAIEGDSVWASATEANHQVLAQASFTAKNMFVRVDTNGLNGPITFRIRKNTANGNMSVAVGAGLTGVFEDLGNTDAFIATDVLNWQYVSGGSSGSAWVPYVGFELEQPAAPPAGGGVGSGLGAAKVLLT